MVSARVRIGLALFSGWIVIYQEMPPYGGVPDEINAIFHSLTTWRHD